MHVSSLGFRTDLALLTSSGSVVEDRGTHLVVRKEALPGVRCAVMAPVPGSSNRFVFALPQPDATFYVGLTDEPVSGAVPDVPEPPEEDIDFLLAVMASALERPLTRDTRLAPLIVATTAGVTSCARATSAPVNVTVPAYCWTVTPAPPPVATIAVLGSSASTWPCRTSRTRPACNVRTAMPLATPSPFFSSLHWSLSSSKTEPCTLAATQMSAARAGAAIVSATKMIGSCQADFSI